MQGRNLLFAFAYAYLDRPDIWDHLRFHTTVRLSLHSHVTATKPPIGPGRLRGILVSRFFLNLRHVFLKKDESSAKTLTSLRIRVPTITSENLVGNIGAPLRSSPISGPYPPAPSGSSRRRESSVVDDPLLDQDLDDSDDEDLEGAEIVSYRRVFVRLGIDQNIVGEGSKEPSWRREVDGTGVEEEEIGWLVDPKGKNRARTPARSARLHPIGEPGDGGMLPPGRQSLEPAVGEADALLVGRYGYDEGLGMDSRESIEDAYRVDGG